MSVIVAVCVAMAIVVHTYFSVSIIIIQLFFYMKEFSYLILATENYPGNVIIKTKTLFARFGISTHTFKKKEEKYKIAMDYEL